LNILAEFLLRHGYRKVKDIAIDATHKLACIVITKKLLYEKKIYQQTIGDAMVSTFS
jgi:hypothetical protein